MSYRKTYKQKIPVYYKGSVRYNGSVSYPASQNGGTKSYSGSVPFEGVVNEEVEIIIDVDTDEFDASVDRCTKDVKLLTGSVAAMNTAQCAAITTGSQKISQTIINGFINSVKTDLSTQTAALEQTINSKLMLMREQLTTLVEKKKKMESDYQRTTKRYLKIFEDLDKELSNRIHQLDQPVFSFVKEIDCQSDRMLHTDLIHSAVTLNKESEIIQAQIESANVKQHALEAMSQMKMFLTSSAETERTLYESTVEGSGYDTYLFPFCYMESSSIGNKMIRKYAIPETMESSSEKLKERLDFEKMPNQLLEEKNKIQSYFQDEISQKLSGCDEHSSRVRSLINSMFNK